MKKKLAVTLRRIPGKALRPAPDGLDTLMPIQIARRINQEDSLVAAAVRRSLPAVARVIAAAARAIDRGGRLIYVGAGSSGRIAALDAAECPPTFDTDPSTVQFVIAGGTRALASATEADEDSATLGRRDMARKKPGKNDVVIGIAASGRTPYTVAALEYARSRGATTAALACNYRTPVVRAAEIAIVVEVGPEVVEGSSRMKSGTAQKMVLNMISTGAMARLGYVYGNLMVNVHRKNQKLKERGLSVLQQAAGVDRRTAERALRSAGGSVPVALVMLKAFVSRTEARRRLRVARGHVRRAIAGMRTPLPA